MNSGLPRDYTLADLLRVDPIGKLNAGVTASLEQFNATHPLDHELYVSVIMKQITLRATDPEKIAELENHDRESAEGKRAITTILNISPEDFERVVRHQNDRAGAMKDAHPEKTLIRSWRALKHRAGILDVGPDNFPTALTRPLLVLYSADWCPPCRVMRPTFARLRHFFDKADVSYCHDDEWRRSRGIEFIPQFVVYFPSGAEVSSGVPGTTQDLWAVMNNLVTLGQSFDGKGVLECTDEKCEIVPVAK